MALRSDFRLLMIACDFLSLLSRIGFPMTAPLILVLALLAPAASSAPAAVRAWAGHLDLPTYEEDAPDVNPPFDVFETRRHNYPYTLRENLTDRRTTARWRTLELENEYLHCTVLPDLGGHLYGCVDKSNGAQMFYANSAIKKARVAYRGAWTALGVEFNFPVSHNWATVSPVDHAIVPGADGSASVWVGNVDRVYGMQWRVSLTLRPGSSALEQDVTLYNPSDLRHRFYWWNNAGVQVWDDSRIEYPMRFTASHGFKEIDTWPVNQAGVDLRVVGNHTFGPVSQFSHGSREAFMGVYHPRTQAGVVHYSSPEDAPTKKIWSWGRDADGLDWRKALSDDESAYVEVQAGLFRNQETYAFLEPQEVIRFKEFWMPVRRTGGITRANPDAVLHLSRAGTDPTSLALDLNVSRAVRTGSLRVLDGARVVRDEPFHLTPAEELHRVFADLPAGPRYTVEVKDDGGHLLLTHTEDQFDMVAASELKVGPTPRLSSPADGQRTDSDFAEIGRDQELNGKRLLAWGTYEEGRKRFPDSLPLLRAAGRLAVDLERYAEAADLLQKAADRATTDAGVRYHLGLARAALGDDAHARTEWEAARPFRAFAAPRRSSWRNSRAAGDAGRSRSNACGRRWPRIRRRCVWALSRSHCSAAPAAGRRRGASSRTGARSIPRRPSCATKACASEAPTPRCGSTSAPIPSARSTSRSSTWGSACGPTRSTSSTAAIPWSPASEPSPARSRRRTIPRSPITAATRAR